MNVCIDCIPCLVRQTVDAARLVTDSTAVQSAVLRDVLSALRDVDYRQSSPVMSGYIHRIIRSRLKDADPYQSIKRHSNADILEMYPALTKQIQESPSPFETAVRLAIAGNIIDYGVRSHLDSEVIGQTINRALSADICHEELERLEESVARSNSILYLADNAGEIVFDRLLIEQMPPGKVTLAVRGAPAINDATLEDAHAAGLTGLVTVVENGADIPGTVLEKCSPEFNRIFSLADLVISKGQGNWETLNGVSKNICFLLLAKCPLIAEDIGCGTGSMVIHNAYHDA